MLVYRKEERSLGPWIVGTLLFILFLTFTWQDVEGVGNPSRQQDTTTQLTAVADLQVSGQSSFGPEDSPNPPNAVPEPTSLLLLGTGLAAGYMILRKRL